MDAIRMHQFFFIDDFSNNILSEHFFYKLNVKEIIYVLINKMFIIKILSDTD
jgi:hypothetical protein